MNKPDEKFLDDLLQLLTEAPRTQIDEDIVADIKKFISEKHTVDEKYDFIQNISKEPLNMISDNIGVGRITPMVKLACDLDAIYGEPKPKEEMVLTIDDDVMVRPEEPIFSAITVQYVADNQEKDMHDDIMVDIFSYMDDLMWAGKFDVVDDFIKEFCEYEICFQYCLCLLTCAFWAKNKIKNREILIEKTKAQGIKEIGEKDTMSCLKGLI